MSDDQDKIPGSEITFEQIRAFKDLMEANAMPELDTIIMSEATSASINVPNGGIYGGFRVAVIPDGVYKEMGMVARDE